MALLQTISLIFIMKKTSSQHHINIGFRGINFKNPQELDFGPQFALNLLELEMKLNSPLFQTSQVKQLFDLYSKAVEHFDAKDDLRASYFKNKLNNFKKNQKLLTLFQCKQSLNKTQILKNKFQQAKSQAYTPKDLIQISEVSIEKNDQLVDSQINRQKHSIKQRLDRQRKKGLSKSMLEFYNSQ